MGFDLTPVRIAYDNLLDLSAAVVSASSAAASFPASQVQSYFRALRWRSTGISSEYLTANFGSAQIWSVVILWDHNLTTSATVTISGGSDGVSWTEIGSASPTVAGQLVVFLTESNYQYCKIAIADPTNSSAYLEVGRVFVGDYIEAERNYTYGHSVTPVSRSSRTETPNGVVHTLVRPQFKKVAFSFSNVTKTQKDTFKTFVETADTWMPVWLMMNPDEEIDTETYYCTLDESTPSFVETSHNLYAFNLAFTEVT